MGWFSKKVPRPLYDWVMSIGPTMPVEQLDGEEPNSLSRCIALMMVESTQHFIRKAVPVIGAGKCTPPTNWTPAVRTSGRLEPRWACFWQ